MKNPIENGTGQNVASEAEERKHAHTLIHPTIIYPQQIRTHRDIQKERGTVHKKAVNAYRHHTVHTKFYEKNYFNHKIHFSLLRSIFLFNNSRIYISMKAKPLKQKHVVIYVVYWEWGAEAKCDDERKKR